MKKKKLHEGKPVPPKVPHPRDDLVAAEPRMDAKLAEARRAEPDPRAAAAKFKKLSRIARLEREFSGGEAW